MAVCGLLMLAGVTVARPGGPALMYVALSPLFVGSLVLTRFDLWPAGLTALALGWLMRDRHRLGWFSFACAIGVKLYPVVLVPLAVAWTVRRRGFGELLRAFGVFSGALAAIFVPFAIAAPTELWESIRGQLSQPLQIESLGASFLTTFGNPTAMVAQESVSLAAQHGVEIASSVLVGLCLAGALAQFIAGPATTARLARFAAASVCATVAFGKVLSPQFLIWLVPLVALVPGKRGLTAAVVVACAALETQIWFTSHRYGLYIDGYHGAWLVLLRNLMLVAAFATLATPTRMWVRMKAAIPRR